MSNTAMHIFVNGTINRSNSVEADFILSGKRYTIYFRTNSEGILSGNLESFLASAILPCMKAGGNQLIAEGRVSEKFLEGISVIQDIYCKWDTSLNRVEINGAIPQPTIRSDENRVGTFFSGGVDLT